MITIFLLNIIPERWGFPTPLHVTDGKMDIAPPTQAVNVWGWTPSTFLPYHTCQNGYMSFSYSSLSF